MKKAVVALSAILIVLVLLVFLLPTPHQNTPSHANVSGVAAQVSSESNNSQEKLYIVKSWNGKIAVFQENSNKPVEVTDVRVSTLPELDQKLLNQGIQAQGRAELAKVLEDYCS